MNYFKTTLLLAGLTALFLAAGFRLGGEEAMLIALLFAIAGNVFAYWNSDRMVLSMHGARRVGGHTHPRFFGTVEELAARAGMPMPEVYVVYNAKPSAFATGRNLGKAALAATTGLLNSLTPVDR